MRKLWTVIKRELASYFSSPIAYIFIVVFLLLSGFFTFKVGQFFELNEASLRAFFKYHPILYLVLIPAVGMHLWAEERKQGTIELLFTLPLSRTVCLFGKLLAAWAFIAIALFLTFPMIVAVYYLGEPDGGLIVSGYLSSLLLAGSYLSITMMTSALSKNQVISFILAECACIFLVLLGTEEFLSVLTDHVSSSMVHIISACSVVAHYNNLQKGLIHSRDIIYFLSLICYPLFLTSVILRSRRAG